MVSKLSGCRPGEETSQCFLKTSLPKEELIQMIKRTLGLEKNFDLDFLSKLEPGELRILLATLRDGIERGAR